MQIIDEMPPYSNPPVGVFYGYEYVYAVGGNIYRMKR